MKPLFPTAVILVCDPIHVSHLNSILMLCECFGERMTLEVALKYWSRTWIKISSFGSKYPCALFMQKKGSLSELGNQWFLAFLVVVVGHMFKGVQWWNVNNANMMSRRNIRNLSLAYSDICVGFWHEVIGKIHIQNLSKHLRWPVLPK